MYLAKGVEMCYKGLYLGQYLGWGRILLKDESSLGMNPPGTNPPGTNPPRGRIPRDESSGDKSSGDELSSHHLALIPNGGGISKAEHLDATASRVVWRVFLLFFTHKCWFFLFQHLGKTKCSAQLSSILDYWENVVFAEKPQNMSKIFFM